MKFSFVHLLLLAVFTVCSSAGHFYFQEKCCAFASYLVCHPPPAGTGFMWTLIDALPSGEIDKVTNPTLIKLPSISDEVTTL